MTTLVKNHYRPKISEASASLIFHNRVRKPSETIQVFAAELRRLSQPCNYGNALERVLRDRFVAGINDKEIQEKILCVTDDELTFDRAYKIAESHEAAIRNVREMQRGHEYEGGSKVLHTRKKVEIDGTNRRNDKPQKLKQDYKQQSMVQQQREKGAKEGDRLF